MGWRERGFACLYLYLYKKREGFGLKIKASNDGLVGPTSMSFSRRLSFLFLVVSV
jgi:hypothetical protein